MKEFNLDAALNCEPVKLRSGHKAYICHKTPDCYVYKNGEKIKFPLHGFIIKADNMLEVPSMVWNINGRAYKDDVDDVFDVIGMFEEPKISIEDLPKPFKPKDGEFYYRITSRTIFDTLGIREKEYSSPEYDDKTVNQGNAFRTREDAQKWLDFMKSMME